MVWAVTILVWLIEGTVWFALVALIVRPFGIRLPIWWWHRPESAAAAVRAGNCSWYWRSKGVDVTAYNTEEDADDVDDLHRALGATKISLLGHSYGTELALSVIRRHGDSVDRAVLASVEGPGDHDTMPWVLDLQLKKIAR